MLTRRRRRGQPSSRPRRSSRQLRLEPMPIAHATLTLHDDTLTAEIGGEQAEELAVRVATFAERCDAEVERDGARVSIRHPDAEAMQQRIARELRALRLVV